MSVCDDRPEPFKAPGFIAGAASALSLLMLAGCGVVSEPAEEPTVGPGVTSSFEDQDAIRIENGYRCSKNNDYQSEKDKKDNVLTFRHSLFSKNDGYDRGAVVLNGWLLKYRENNAIADLGVVIYGAYPYRLEGTGSTIDWSARGWLRNSASSKYSFCYVYTALMWNHSLLDVDYPQDNGSPSAWNAGVFNAAESPQAGPLNARGYLEDRLFKKYKDDGSFLAKKTVAVLPLGFLFGWGEKSTDTGDVKSSKYEDHHLLQIGYNLDHIEVFTPNSGSTPAKYGDGVISWISQGILKDDSTIRPFYFNEKVMALEGNDVALVHPPFAISPRRENQADASNDPQKGVKTEKVTITGLPFKYAVPVLTGWDLYFCCEESDERVRDLGVWLSHVEYTKSLVSKTGTLTYTVSSVLGRELKDKSFDSRHRVTVLGLGGTGADLVPVILDAAGSCFPPTGPPTHLPPRSVQVGVRNRGFLDSGGSKTRISFGVDSGTYVDVDTPPIPAGKMEKLDPVDVPVACFTPDCKYYVTADSKSQVTENRDNNVAEGKCNP